MANEIEQWRQRQWLRYVACYVLYIVLIALATIVVFVIWRQTFLVLITLFAGTKRVSPVFYMLGIIFSGFAAFILVMVAEPYLRTGVPKQLLLRRFIRMALPLVIIGAAGLLLNLWGFWALGM